MLQLRFLIPILVILCGFTAGTLLPSNSYAQEAAEEAPKKKRSNKKERRAPPKTRKADTWSEQVGKQMLKVQEYFEKEDYPGAKSLLTKLSQRRKLKPFEAAKINQFLGYVEYELGTPKSALKFFEKALAGEGLPPNDRNQLTFNVAQLMLQEGQVDKAISMLQGWFKANENPKADAFFIMANAYVMKEDFKSALKWANQGLDRVTNPREQWLQMAVGLNFQDGKYEKCREILETLVSKWPKKQYWRQLSGIYGQLKLEKEQLAAFELTHRQGMLTSSNELVQMAQLYMYHEVPFKAGKLVEASLADGTIDDTQKNWKLLADAWIAAREMERAIEPLKKAADRDDNGELYIQLAQLYVEREDWEKAIDALQKGRRKGGLKNTGQTHFLEGVAHYNLKKRSPALKSFDRAIAASKSDSSTTKNSGQWKRIIQGDIRRDQQNREFDIHLRKQLIEAGLVEATAEELAAAEAEEAGETDVAAEPEASAEEPEAQVEGESEAAPEAEAAPEPTAETESPPAEPTS